MRTGFDYKYRFALISRQTTPVAVVGVGGPHPTGPVSAVGRPRGFIIAEGDVFVFVAACPDSIVARRREGLANTLAAFLLDGDLTRVLADFDHTCSVSEVQERDFRLAPRWSLGAEIDRLYRLEVLATSPVDLRLLKPPAVWAREMPAIVIFPLNRKK